MKQDKEAPSASSGIYFEVENLDATYRKLRELGVNFVTEPETRGWGDRTAMMLDPDNNVIALTERTQK